MSILSNVAGLVNRVKFQTVKHSPEILVVAGVAGMVATTVIACKQTTKLNDILEKRKEQIKMVHDSLNDESISEEEYSKAISSRIFFVMGFPFLKSSMTLPASLSIYS